MSSVGSEIVSAYGHETMPPRLGQIPRPSAPPVSTRVIRDLVRLSDVVLFITAAVLAWLPTAQPAPGPFIVAGIVAAVTAVMIYSRTDLYSLAMLLGPGRRTGTAAAGIAAGTVTAGAELVLTGMPYGVIWQWTVLWAALAGGGLLLGRSVSLTLLRHWHAQGRLDRKMAIVGVNALSAALINRIDMGSPNTSVVGLYVERDEDAPPSQAGVPVLGGLDDLIVQVRVQAIDTIVVALPLIEQARVERICERLRDVACDVYLTADVVGLRYGAAAIADLDGHPVIVVRQRPLKDWQGVQKRAFDLAFGWLFMLILAPAMAIIAGLIRLDSPGPVLFRQRRLGFNNNVITVLKFRTMYHHASDPLANRLTERNDPRVTPLGRILRKYSLDELPQIFNVISGEMSLVGPRPHALNAKAANRYYGDVVAEYARRHVVKPGITGWAQVSGWRGETRTEEQIRQRVAHDLHYIENWSLGFDLRILWLTAVRELFSRHAF
ncbi:Undecaprenyl-phosphate glucose phosphotransferase [Rhodovastum atsumiense]|uniref:Undecaprenyl-phosphate glucose phosphotransferase n=1 Tax=Rhodovastum atsumiense TaxID=504468 RepID=A0A5M6IRM8_9PROT|nr:undecaprenyl-phosphate glucose phosphotransferase [Rhodovastum atsumiense]KAA5610953.1 undecaprenyl-phosphate glucose phosphotransferase [Rhodovastum atsumiense]CAH2601470.1 Undecaprenyl-phosphate glucose phosphotransferase [Rhodovastum atsumiense]